MIEKLFPDLYIKSIFDMPLDMFKEKGINVLIFDIDNTVAPFDVAQADDKTADFFEYLRNEGFSLCLLSNNTQQRVELFNKKLKTYPVWKAGKPGIKKLNEVLAYFGAENKNAAMIGDQVFTDMFCAHRAGVLAVYTMPICDRDQMITKVKRGAEKIVLKIYKKRRGLK